MLTVDIHATSHIGRVRKGNEDNYLVLHVSDVKAWTGSQEPNEFVVESQRFEIDANGIVLAVSDGMGGALAGEVASKMAVETVSQKILDQDPEKTYTPDGYDASLIGRLYDATIYANYLIHHTGSHRPAISGNGRDLYRHRHYARGD
jgi:protein phosphatase